MNLRGVWGLIAIWLLREDNMRKDYKLKSIRLNMRLDKRGQVSIFVIVAIVIVAIILIFYVYQRGGLKSIQTGDENPRAYFENCLKPEFESAISDLSSKGGYSEPLGFIVYNGTKVPYLCYTSEYFKTCVVQQANIQGNFEKELNKILGEKAEECASNLKQDYESKGYRVSRQKASVNVSFIPGKMNVEVISPMTLSKDTSRTYGKFDIEYKNEMYDIMAIATSIVDFESTYGDSETTLYINYYPDISIQKTQLSEGSTIYKVRNVVTNDAFTFASRSLAWKEGA